MAINKPTRPDSELPETWGGTQYPYTNEQVQNGFPETIPTIIDGGNLNFEKKGIFERLKYLLETADVLNGTPINQILSVDSNNKFVYKNLPIIATDEEFKEETSEISSPSVKQVFDAFLKSDTFQVVSTLPAEPEADKYYLIPE